MPSGPDRPGRLVAPRAPLSVQWRRLAIVAVGAAVLAADQVSKTWALHHTTDPVPVIWTLRLAVTFNSGTAFGLGRDSTTIIVAGVVVMVVVLLGLGRRASRTANWPATVAMGLLLGGALGNLADRVLRHNHGAVIDFIDLRWWPVFNLADASITVGAFLLAFVGFRARPATGDGSSAPAGGARRGPEAAHDPGARESGARH
jgi:signal peptidase II